MYKQIFKPIFTLSLIVLTMLNAISQDVKIFDSFSDLETKYFDVNDDRVHVINFWTTWCKPCVKELPYIDALTEKYGEEIKVTLVSLDFPRKMDTKLVPFIIQNQLKSEVVLLDDGKVNDWINKVNSEWSGAIPATVFLYKNEKLFFEKEFHSQSEIEKVILKLKSSNNSN